MSVPAELRRKPKRQRKSRKRVPAKLDHASNPKAVRRRREGEKKMRRSRGQ